MQAKALHAYLCLVAPMVAGRVRLPAGARPLHQLIEGIISMEHVTTENGQMPSNTASRKYMWMITVQWPMRHGGFGNATLANTVDLPAGASRLEVYSEVLELAKRQTRADSLNVLFFSLEPDQLAA